MSADVNQKSIDSAKKAKQLPPSTQYAIVTALPNVLNGAFWGFDSVKNAQEHYQALTEDKNIIARKIGEDCLLEVNPNYMLKAVQMIDSNAITQSDINIIKKNQSDAQISFEKFLINRGKQKNQFKGAIGIYCTNIVETIKYKGTSYPAFRINLQDTLATLSQYGYGVVVGNQLLTAKDAYESGQAIWDSMQVSPTKTGVFINIQYLGTSEQMKQLEVVFKQKYGAK